MTYQRIQKSPSSRCGPLIKTDVSRGGLDKTAESLQIETDTSEVFIARSSVLNWHPGELQNQGWPWGQTIQVYFILVGLRCARKKSQWLRRHTMLHLLPPRQNVPSRIVNWPARPDINQWIWRTRSWLHFPLFFGGQSTIKRLIGTLLWGSIRTGQAVIITKQTGHWNDLYK